MDKIILNAEERTVLGKKVQKLRREGFTPGHVFGNKVETEHVSVPTKEFFKIYDQAGETALVDLKIGTEKVRPVLIRDLQFDPVRGELLHIDFYQVNLKEKVAVPVPLVLIGDEPEKVHSGEAIVLQPLSEIQVESLPTDLIDQIEVNINTLKEIDDSITVADLLYDRTKLTVLADPDEVVVKLAPAVTEEMEALLEEQAAETEAAQAEATAEEGGEASIDSSSETDAPTESASEETSKED